MFKFLHTYIPESVFFQFGSVNIHWYGLLIAAGVAAAYIVAKILFKKHNINPKLLDDLPFYVLIPAVLCGRLYYVLYAWEFYKDNLLEIFKIWHGGMALHGDILGGAIGILIFVKVKKINFYKLADIVAPGLSLGTAIGRWGNYFNQELFGKPTNLPWGIPIEAVNRPEKYYDFKFFHPAFLYESVLDFLLFLVLILLHLKKRKPAKGVVMYSYFLGYGLIRFMMEFWRIDYSPLVLGVRWAQIVSVIVILAGFIGLVFIKSYKKTR